MVKASALHLALVIALVVSILLGSLIYLHYFYRSQQQKLDRWETLRQEIESATTLTLSNDFPYTLTDSLFPSEIYPTDSLAIGKRHWGFFDAVTIRSWRDTDTLKRSFLAGIAALDSTVLYIVDEDRPLSISGKTIIQGTALFPKSGIRPAFVDGEYYDGIEEMVDGEIKESTRSLPAVQGDRIGEIRSLYDGAPEANHDALPYDALPYDAVLRKSFFAPTQYYHTLAPTTILQDSVQGNIVIIADSAVTVSSQTAWENAILIAPYIKLEDNFEGAGQFFALDSMRVGNDVHLRYPSVLALLIPDTLLGIGNLTIGENSRLEGLALVYREHVTDQKDLLELAKNSSIAGEAISFGMLKYTDPITIHGALYAYRFITQRPSSLYENYLINLQLEREKRHPYYIGPHIWTEYKKAKQAIVQWLR